MNQPLALRFWAKVEKGANCWRWTGFIDKGGYGRIREAGRDTPILYAHRVAYEFLIGSIPEGLQLDHLCRNKWCCNPQHLEPVTMTENLRRGDVPVRTRLVSLVCPKGHPRSENAYVWPKTGQLKMCRACRNQRRRALYAERIVAQRPL